MDRIQEKEKEFKEIENELKFMYGNTGRKKKKKI